jgi:hypothetical protein
MCHLQIPILPEELIIKLLWHISGRAQQMTIVDTRLADTERLTGTM